MDTQTIVEYYKEADPMKRKALLEQSIAAGEDVEGNAIRKELWGIRYGGKSDSDKGNRADGYLAMWMQMEFNKGASGKLFGLRGARKEMQKTMDKLQFSRYQKGTEREQELFYRELLHMIKLYIDLCLEDRSYGTYFAGLINMKKDKVREKLQKDLFDVGIQLPFELELEDFRIVSRATREMYELQFPGEGGLPQPEMRTK